ncbi:hypothetical protein M1V64_25450 [Escherichia coli]|uniref:hypothetical protein n=1 Tax=Escherichia coli TaxID=562 RepID=UPI002090345E|nr:hypothetical protein [Escherichia coli]MCO4921779.1 hypothetical protein [Escherichia coli]
MKTLTFNNGTVSVGDVFVSSWGYEQTNVNFYQVISVHGKKTVTVQEIRASVHRTHFIWCAVKLRPSRRGECQANAAM